MKTKIEIAFAKVMSKEFMQVFGKRAVEIIYRRVKSGKGLDSTGNKTQTLKPLSPRYIAQRAKEKNLGEYGRPAKSNLTLTGQMLASLKMDAFQNGFRISVPPTSRKDSKLTNEKVAEYVTDQGRPFLGMSEGERRILTREIILAFKKELGKLR